MAAVTLTLARILPGIAPNPPAVIEPVAVSADGALFTRGDVFTVEGRFAHNPITGTPTGVLQRFVVMADVTALDVPMQIWPNVVTQRQNDTWPDIYPWQAQPFMIGQTTSEATETVVNG